MSRLHEISGCKQADRKADVVFIHGLGGDAFGTWRHGKDNSTSWPYWLGEEFTGVAVWSLGYAASPTKWARPLGWFFDRWQNAGHGMSLPDRAGQALDLMLLRGLGERPLFFICHSLGGLLAKQILRTSSDALDERKKRVFSSTRAVLFLATPHAGAALASLVSSFRTVLGATVTLEDLQAHDAHLRNLFDWYRNHANASGIETAAYFELKGVTIVNPTSAHPGVGADPVGLDEGHISIVKPRERDAQVCLTASDMLRRHVLAPRPAPIAMAAHAAAVPAHPPPITVRIDASAIDRPSNALIPHELPPAAENFFGRQRELNLLIERLRAGKNTAVVGPGGLGKTALAANALHAVVGDPTTPLAGTRFPDGVVYLDLYTFRGEAERTWDTLADKVAGAEFLERATGRERAAEACRARNLLIVIEGGEEADGVDGRASISELFGVLSPQNRWLLLTRLSTQAAPAESIVLREALDPDDSARLLDSLTQGRLAADWAAERLPGLTDPRQAEHTLEWLFNRSVRGLDDTARRALEAAGLLARAPFPLEAIASVVEESGEEPARAALRALVQRGLLRLSEVRDHWQFTHVLGYRFARRESGSAPEIRARLAHWLHAHLKVALAAGVPEPLELTRALEHLAALLRADDDRSLWYPLANFALYDARDRLTDLGRLGLVNLSLGAVSGWLERFPGPKAQETAWLREKSVLFNHRGSVLRDQGDLAGALAAYRESLAVSRRLAEADPSNAGWQRDLSVSLNNVGRVLGDQGDLAGALAAYRESLAVSRRLAEADPSNAGWQRDLSLSLTLMAQIHERQGERAEALRLAEESLRIDERLASLDRTNATWQKDVAFSRAFVDRLRR